MEWLYVPVYQKRASYPLVLGFFILYGCSYRSASMSHTVYTTWISSVDFKLGQTTQLIKDWSIFNHLCPSRSSNHNRAITTAPISVKLWIIQTRKSNVFFEKKMWPENVQEFSKLTLFLISTFFCFKKYHFMLPTFLGRALLLPNDALKPKPSTLKPQTFDQTLLSVFVCW